MTMKARSNGKPTAVSSAKNPAALTFETALQTLGVRRAFDTLVRKKIDRELLEYWLRNIADAPDKYGHEPNDKRRATQLVRHANRLADEIERARNAPPIPIRGRWSDFQSLPTLESTLPGMLRTYASCWDHICNWKGLVQTGPKSPRTDKIWVLLDIVKKCTRRYHYREIADLINVLDLALRPGKGDKPLTVEDLTQLQFRGNLKMKKLNGSRLERKRLQVAANRRRKTISSKQSDS
jgi:hypothetical protein